MEWMVAVFTFVVVLSVITSVTKIITRAIERRGTTSPKALAEIEQRLGRIEQAVDAIAIEVERVSEGQRFTTRLLSERSSSPVRE